jgi:hypothetical protein
MDGVVGDCGRKLSMGREIENCGRRVKFVWVGAVGSGLAYGNGGI